MQPSGLEQSQFDDFFDIKFAALPHKVFQYDNFVKEVSSLRTWFQDPNSPNYLFQPKYHKQIPADGFYKFVADIGYQSLLLSFLHPPLHSPILFSLSLSLSIKEKINSNKDLDLPTQKQLLAQFRCDEKIAAVAFGKVAKATKKSVAEVEGGAVIADLGQTLNTLRSAALDEYHTTAHRYDQAVYEKVKESLRDKIHANFYPLLPARSQPAQAYPETVLDDITVPAPPPPPPPPPFLQPFSLIFSFSFPA